MIIDYAKWCMTHREMDDAMRYIMPCDTLCYCDGGNASHYAVSSCNDRPAYRRLVIRGWAAVGIILGHLDCLFVHNLSYEDCKM